MQTIYFPSLNAEAIADVNRGGTASVFGFWNGEAYVGEHRRAKFTTIKPANWAPDHFLSQISCGGFAFNVEAA